MVESHVQIFIVPNGRCRQSRSVIMVEERAPNVNAGL